MKYALLILLILLMIGYTVINPGLSYKKSPFQSSATPTQYHWFTPRHDLLLRQIRQAETGNGVLVGDNGNSLGPYQIQYNYWFDAVEHSPEIGGEYYDVMDEEYARLIVLSYWDRYGHRVNYSIEGLARMHNGGCNIYSKKDTEIWDRTTDYWIKINEN